MLAPLIILLIPAVMFISLFINSSKAVASRIKIQTEADCAASSVSAWFATGMNQLAICNLSLEALDIMRNDIYKATSGAINKGKIALINSEIRRIERFKDEISARIPTEANNHKREGNYTIASINTSYSLSLPIQDSRFDTSMSRIITMCSEKNSIALSSMRISSKANGDQTIPMVPDFVPIWHKVSINSAQFDLFNSINPAGLKGWTTEKLNNEISH